MKTLKLKDFGHSHTLLIDENGQEYYYHKSGQNWLIFDGHDPLGSYDTQQKKAIIAAFRAVGFSTKMNKAIKISF